MAINILPTRRNLRFKLNPSKALTLSLIHI